MSYDNNMLSIIKIMIRELNENAERVVVALLQEQEVLNARDGLTKVIKEVASENLAEIIEKVSKSMPLSSPQEVEEKKNTNLLQRKASKFEMEIKDIAEQNTLEMFNKVALEFEYGV